MNHGLRRGYAAATMDSGHWGAHRADGRWAWNNRLAENDWGWRGVTETARVAKVLVSAFYGQAQQKSYFAGCSTGGRMALMAAQRFPADFDGIIAGAPALDYTGLVAWADPIVTPWRTLQYVEDVQRRMGGPEKTDSFLRFFLPPVSITAVADRPGCQRYWFRSATGPGSLGRARRRARFDSQCPH